MSVEGISEYRDGLVLSLFGGETYLGNCRGTRFLAGANQMAGRVGGGPLAQVWNWAPLFLEAGKLGGCAGSWPWWQPSALGAWLGSVCLTRRDLHRPGLAASG